LNRAFEQFAAWRLELLPPRPELRRAAQDEEARQRWDGEGGNPGMPPVRRKRDRANRLARLRRARTFETQETAWKPTAATQRS
jgi:hypothetical protein